MLDDYLKTNPGVKELPREGIEPQPPNPQSDAAAIRPWRPGCNEMVSKKTIFLILTHL